MPEKIRLYVRGWEARPSHTGAQISRACLRQALHGVTRSSYVLRRDYLQQLCGWKQRARFLVVEQLGSVFKDLELSARSISDLHFHTFFGCGFAQAPGRATQIESEKAALHFNHFSSSKLPWQRVLCSRESLPCPVRCARSRRRKSPLQECRELLPHQRRVGRAASGHRL